MKTFALGKIAQIAVLSTMLGSVSASAVIINGVNWNNVYDPNATTYNYLPNQATPAWALGASGGTASITGNYLTLTTTDPSTENRYYTITSGWDGNSAAGMTLETSFRVDPRGGNRVTSIAVSNSSKYIYLNFSQNTIFYSGGSAAGTLASGLNFTTVNTLRLTLAQDLTLTVYLNNNATPVGVLNASNFSTGTSAPNNILFGDAATNVGGTSQWDYIAWTPGIHAVPEPHTVALLIPLIGFVLFRMRRMAR